MVQLMMPYVYLEKLVEGDDDSFKVQYFGL